MAANTKEQRRVMLWAPPRSLSTAFERCISVLHDSMCVDINHEMFTAACHLGPNRQIKIPRIFEPIVYEPKLSYKHVKKLLEAEKPGCDLVFCKELAYTMDGKFDMIPDSYRHTFLIRHPAKVFLSYHNFLHKFPNNLLRLDLRNILPKGLIYKELYDLMQYTKKTLGQEPIIIDADDLVENPEVVLRLYCKAVDVPYDKNMTTWRRCKDDLREWTYSKKLMFVNKVMRQYDRAFSTPGLIRPEEPMDIDVNCLPRKIKEFVTYALPFYEEMYECRLRPDDKGDSESSPEVLSDSLTPSLKLPPSSSTTTCLSPSSSPSSSQPLYASQLPQNAHVSSVSASVDDRVELQERPKIEL